MRAKQARVSFQEESKYDRLIGEAFIDITVPVYSIVSDMNNVDIAATRRYAPSFEVIYMSGVGHFVMIEDPETFNELLSEVIGKWDNQTLSA